MEADTPHQAAVHLLSSIDCCKDCSADERDQIELRELNYQKELLTEKLQQLNIHVARVHALQSQVLELGQLAGELQKENDQAYQIGKIEIQRIRHKSHEQAVRRKELVGMELLREKERNIELNRQWERLKQKVVSLNAVNQLLTQFIPR